MNFDVFAKKCRALIPEGITLLEHDGALPFYEGEKVAVFGRGQYEYLKSGSGSGGSHFKGTGQIHRAWTQACTLYPHLHRGAQPVLYPR